MGVEGRTPTIRGQEAFLVSRVIITTNDCSKRGQTGPHTPPYPRTQRPPPTMRPSCALPFFLGKKTKGRNQFHSNSTGSSDPGEYPPRG